MAYCCKGGAHANDRSVKWCLTNDATKSFKKIHKVAHRVTHYSRECEYDANLKYLIYPPRRFVCYIVQRNPPWPSWGKVVRLLMSVTEVAAYTNKLSGCPTVGSGANLPHWIHFFPVMSSVSFDPFSVTLCLPSWYRFNLLCPLRRVACKQTAQMRNLRYWWPDS